MPDGTTDVEVVAGTGADDVQAGAADDSTEPEAGKTYDAAYVKKLREEAKANRLEAEAARKQLAEQAKEREKAAEAKAREERRFEELADKYKAEAEAARAEIEGLRLTAMKQKAATDAGIPLLWERLQGTTEEELAADATKLLAAMPKPSAGNLNGGARGPAPDAQADFSHLAGIYNIAPEHFGKSARK